MQQKKEFLAIHEKEPPFFLFHIGKSCINDAKSHFSFFI